MIIICIRTILIYIALLLALRIMGKAELSKVSTFQMVVLFMIAELAAMPIDSPSVSLANGITAISTLLFLEVLLSYLSTKSEHLKNFINGKPSILIDKGKINVKEMKRQRITINDLFEQLRIEGLPSPSEIEYAIMESNGELSVIQNTPPDLLPFIFIADGAIYDKNLQYFHLNRRNLLHMLKERGISSVEDVFVAYYDTSNKLHVYPQPKKDSDYVTEVTPCAH